jgi:hypothetical protein
MAPSRAMPRGVLLGHHVPIPVPPTYEMAGPEDIVRFIEPRALVALNGPPALLGGAARTR